MRLFKYFVAILIAFSTISPAYALPFEGRGVGVFAWELDRPNIFIKTCLKCKRYVPSPQPRPPVYGSKKKKYYAKKKHTKKYANTKKYVAPKKTYVAKKTTTSKKIVVPKQLPLAGPSESPPIPTEISTPTVTGPLEVTGNNIRWRVPAGTKHVTIRVQESNGRTISEHVISNYITIRPNQRIQVLAR